MAPSLRPMSATPLAMCAGLPMRIKCSWCTACLAPMIARSAANEPRHTLVELGAKAKLKSLDSGNRVKERNLDEPDNGKWERDADEGSRLESRADEERGLAIRKNETQRNRRSNFRAMAI
ncbi:hypothetical protein B0H14DRAFT_2565373 [Mycena olivaceomarginata]|nr:hypothetical protein B0H14DRAFT_2565373 [Mycena olivaceomarginata]